MWRVGMAGAGWVSQYHLIAWQKQAHRAEVVAIADPDERVRLARLTEGGRCKFHTSAVDMMDAGPIDILDICAPVEAHVPLTRAAVERGIAVLCQKPMAATLDEAMALVSDLGASRRVMIHDNWRFRATYRRIREWLDARIAGDVRRVQLDYLSSGMIRDASGQRPAIVRQPNFPTLERLLVMEVMIHHLDTLRFLMGELDLVTATLGRSNDDIIGEDIATMTLRTTDGTPVLLAGNLAVHGEPPQARDRLHIYGSKATIVLDGYQLSCVGETTVTETFDPVLAYQGAYDAAITHFLDTLEAGGQFETAPADNLRTLALVEAAYAADASRVRMTP